MKERGPDLAMVILAVVVAALAHVTSFAGLLGATVVAFVVVDVARVIGWPDPATLRVPRSALVLGIAVIVAVPLRELASRAGAIVENERLGGLVEHLGDRARTEELPSIAPPIVPGDRPLTYFVRARGEHVRVRLDERGSWIDAEPLGHDVFRVDYDPAQHGAPPPEAHECVASIDVDGNVATRAMIAATPAPHPRWLRTSPDRTRACAPSEETDEVIVVGVGLAPRSVPVLDGPTDCAIADDGALLVAHRYARALLAIEGSERRTIELGRSGAVAVARSSDSIVVALEGAEPELIRIVEGELERVSLEGRPTFLAAEGSTLVVSTIAPASIARVATHGPLHIERSRALVTPAVHLALTPGGASVVLALTDFVEDGAPHLGNHYVEDRLVTLDAESLEVLEDRPTARRTSRQDHAGDVDRGASPMGLSFGADGTLVVAFAGTDEVWEQRGVAPPRRLDVAAASLSAPFSAITLADGSLVVTSPSSGRVATFGPDRSLTGTLALAPSDRELLRADPDALQIRFGERAFYEATRSGISCQSCHLHGGSDGAFHNIGGRLAAPTLDVRGVVGTSPYLRDGSYPSLRDLHEVAVTEYRGYREPAGDRARTMEAWMRTLPPPATHARRDPEHEREGLDVFFRAGCPDCHAPPAFTSLALHAIEAVFPDAEARREGRTLDTPSLRSLAVSAPYLHDGRARSLESIFREHNASDRHGHTRALTPDELDALLSFLRST